MRLVSVDDGLLPIKLARARPCSGGRRSARDPLRHGVHFWLTDAADNVLLRRRPPEGLLGGMTELPGTEKWRGAPWTLEEALASPYGRALAPGRRGLACGFHPFRADHPACCRARATHLADGYQRPVGKLADEALPSVMRKCVRMAAASQPDGSD